MLLVGPATPGARRADEIERGAKRRHLDYLEAAAGGRNDTVNETQTEAPHPVLEGLMHAWNAHDIEAFVDCFDAEYRSDQPAHPARSFEGNAQVRANWSEIFDAIPDFAAQLLSFAEQGERIWAEWRWTGTQKDGGRFEWRGVTLFGVREGRIAWARLYMEPVERAGADIRQTVQEMAQGTGDS